MIEVSPEVFGVILSVPVIAVSIAFERWMEARSAHRRADRLRRYLDDAWRDVGVYRMVADDETRRRRATLRYVGVLRERLNGAEQAVAQARHEARAWQGAYTSSVWRHKQQAGRG